MTVLSSQIINPQARRYREQINILLNYAHSLRAQGRPILQETLVKYALVNMRVRDRTAKSYAKAVITILEEEYVSTLGAESK